MIQAPNQQPPMQPMQPGIVPPQTPQQNRHMSPMNPRSTPQPSHLSGGQPGYYSGAVRQSQIPPGAMPPSAKRFKPTPPGAPHPNVAAAAQAAALGVGGDPAMTIEEEEDTSRGDLLDHFTPREIATTRYIQHHEWMEEVLGSAYSINRIKPVDLGLGLRGDLESVTQGLLDPPVYPNPKPRINDPPEEPKDHKKILVEFRPRAEKKIQELEEDMRQMEIAHAKRLASIKKTSIFRDAEKELRDDVDLLAQRVPAKGEDGEDAPLQPSSPAESKRDMDEIVRGIEEAYGRKVGEAQIIKQWGLPADVLSDWGVVVAEGNGGADTTMGGISNRSGPTSSAMEVVNGLEDTLGLDIPTPNDDSITGHSMALGDQHPADSNIASHMLDEYRQPNADEPMMEDTMMADFMNVDDDLAKTETPIGDSARTASGTPAMSMEPQVQEQPSQVSPSKDTPENPPTGGSVDDFLTIPTPASTDVKDHSGNPSDSETGALASATDAVGGNEATGIPGS